MELLVVINGVGCQTSQENGFECTVFISVAAVAGDSGTETKREGDG